MFADKEASALFLGDLRINVPQLKEWLRLTAKGIARPSVDSAFLFRLEKQLKIDNSQYKSARRLASDWGNLKHGQKTLVITRIVQALRARAVRSELMPVMMKLAKEKKYVPVNPVKDMEKAQPVNTKGGMATRSKIAMGIGLTGASTYGAYRLAKHLTGKKGKSREWRDKIGRGHAPK